MKRAKALLIVIMVSVVSGGFILGYFVGKGVSSPAPFSSVKPSVNETTPVAPSPDRNSDLKGETASFSGIAEQDRPSGDKQASAIAVSNEALPVKAEARPEKTGARDEDISSESSVVREERIFYTVQAGAFKHRKEALAVKKNLEANGITSSVKKEANSKGVQLFKVRTGEFEKKKEAEVFALRLQKEFGLNSIVVNKK